MNYSTSHILVLPDIPKKNLKIYLHWHHRDIGHTNDLAIPTFHCRERCLNAHIKLKGFTHQFTKSYILSSQQLQNDGESWFWRLISKFKACLEGDGTQTCTRQMQEGKCCAGTCSAVLVNSSEYNLQRISFQINEVISTSLRFFDISDAFLLSHLDHCATTF